MITLLLSLVLQTSAPTTTPATTPATAPATAPASQAQPAAQVPLAVAVWKAHGGENWADVEQINFTFKVDRNGHIAANVQHEWNIKTGIDIITIGDQTTEVNVHQPADTAAAKQAYARWVNDAYWLLAPLKLMDGGVLATELPATPDYRRLLIEFENVGLTPTDKYLYHVDPETHRILAWTYMPANAPEREFTWSGYETLGPLTLSLDHETAEGFRVYFEDVTVE